MFIGRTHEIGLIRQRLADRSKAQLIVIYGRRRVGKSTLIREATKRERKVLLFEGIEGEQTAVQIEQFLDDLSRQTGRVRLRARNWREVFQGLGEIVERGRWVLVFDEFPWMGAGRSRIVSELKLYWDRWSRNQEVCLILCGSVASFMTRHVVHSRALHNRKTLELCLPPLSPAESALFIPRRSAPEKAQMYMCLGGVPKYLEQIDPRRSLARNLNSLCFTSNGFFTEEYETLFKEQFRSLKVYQSIVESLSRHPASLSELSAKLKLPRGGGLKEQLHNLQRAQFVREYEPVPITGTRRARTRVYKLIDPFLLFYFRYIQPHRGIIRRNRRGEDLFHSIVAPTVHQYYGYAFERLNEDAMDRVLDRIGLGLADVEAMGPFFQQRRSESRGLQIDWLIMRRDGVWTMVEYKYHTAPVGTEAVSEVKQKLERLPIPDGISVEPVLISASGTTDAVKRSRYFAHVLGLHDLLR